MVQRNLINPPAPFSITELSPRHTPCCRLVLSEESLEPYLLALFPTLRPCLGHSLYIHPCPSHTCPRSPRRTACTTSGKYNRFFHPHASVLTTDLESSHSSKPKSKLNILKNDLTTHIIPDLKSINAEKQQQQNRKQL